MTRSTVTAALCVVSLATLMSGSTASAQDLYVYPANGQSEQQLADDRYACHRWAVTETGFDPSQVSDVDMPKTVRVPVPENAQRGATAQGTAIGAVAGGIIGAHDSNVGKGAAIGAVIGTLAGAIVEDQGQQQAAEQAREEAQAIADAAETARTERALKRAAYQRAITACLDGRGYVVR